MFDKLKAYKNYSNDCVFFKIIFDEKDLNTTASETGKNTTVKSDEELNNCFKPEFTHQIFGDDETIFGYKNLKIDYYLTPGLLDAYIGLNYTDKITPQRYDGIEADDVYQAFANFGCSPGFTRNLDVFCTQKLAEDKQFRPFGVKIHEYQKQASYKFKDITNNQPNDCTNKFEIYKVDSSQPEYESQKFIDYLERIQTMLVYYIETSNFIDYEDPKWVHYILYEKRKSSGSDARFVTIGYLSAYNFYAYPDKTRCRVSQMLILPPYQSAGHGAELLESIYRDAAQCADIVDVTAESPSPEFMNLRDFVTSKLCAELSSFRDLTQLNKGYSIEMVKEALKNFKIPRLQSRRSYEIIRMANTNENNDQQWHAFSLDIKKRFYATFLRYSKFARNSKSLNADEEQEQEKSAPSTLKADLKSNFNFKKPSSEKISALNSRFGFDTIGFGSSTSSGAKSSSTVENASSSSSCNATGMKKKVVSFSNIKEVSFSSTDNSGLENDDDNYDDQEDDDEKSNQVNYQKLLVSEPERNEYINQQFEEAIRDYRKAILRLEHCNILPF